MSRYRITITGTDREAMLDLVRKYQIDLLDHGARILQDDRYRVDAIVDRAQIQRLESLGYKVERYEDVDEQGKRRQTEVGQGDRYKQP